MRALMLEPPPELLEERRRKGLDRWDEVWDGVIHMVPPPSRWHQSLEKAFILVLEPLVRLQNLEFIQESGLYRSDQNYRVPDLMVFRPEHWSDRGVESHAEVVIELLSPHDESREKLPFYESLGVNEVFLIDPGTRAIAALSPARRPAPACAPGRHGSVSLRNPGAGASSGGWPAASVDLGWWFARR